MPDEPSTPRVVAIVDDDASVRTALARLLGSMGLACSTHESGEAYLASPEFHEADCVLLDVHMPGLSGPEVLVEVREAATKVPVVLMTARYDADFARRAIESGASAFLRKPFGETELAAAISEATGWPTSI